MERGFIQGRYPRWVLEPSRVQVQRLIYVQLLELRINRVKEKSHLVTIHFNMARASSSFQYVYACRERGATPWKSIAATASASWWQKSCG